MRSNVLPQAAKRFPGELPASLKADRRNAGGNLIPQALRATKPGNMYTVATSMQLISDTYGLAFRTANIKRTKKEHCAHVYRELDAWSKKNL